MRIAWVMLMMMGCRPQLMAPADHAGTALNVWQDLVLAHTGGRTLTSMRFLTQETFSPGVGAALFPETLQAVASNVFLDFAHGRAWQVSKDQGHRVVWELDETGAFLATRDGIPEDLLPGLDRGARLRMMLRLLRPWRPSPSVNVELTLLSPRAGFTRLRFEDAAMREANLTPESWVVEVDPRTGWVAAVEHSAWEFHLPRVIRAEYSDYRNVADGIMVAHTITEHLLTGAGPVPFHEITLWNTAAEVKSAYPHGESPGQVRVTAPAHWPPRPLP